MKLKKLRLENFRSYRELDINFDYNMNIIIGKNDVGKSTVMEALEIFFNNDLVKLQQDDLNIDAQKEGMTSLKIILSFKVEDSDTIVIDSSNPTNLEDEFLLDKNGLLTLIQECDCSKNITKASIKYSLECDYPSVWKDKPKINLKINDLKKELNELVDNEVISEEAYESITKSANAPIRQALYKYLLEEEDKNDRTTIQIDLAKGDESKSLKESIDKNLPLYFLFQSDRANKDSDDDVQNPLKIAIQKALQNDKIKNMLDEVEKLMKEQIKQVGDDTLAKLQEMDPAIASTLNPNYSKEPDWKSVFKFNFTGNDIPLNKRGSGVRRLVLLNYFRAEADRKINDRYNKSVIYAIEEPETSQHPDYQQMLIKSLLELSSHKNHQVIITTHTPNIAKMVELENVIAIIKDETGNIKKYKDFDLLFEDIKNTLGVLPSIDIKNISKVKCIVCLEGKLDVEFLLNINDQISEYKEIIELKDNNEILIIPMGGSTIQYWANKNLLKKLQINQVHIYDSDIGSDEPNKYSKYFDSINSQGLNNFTFETKKREMENYIHHNIINDTYEGFPIIYSEEWDTLDLGEEVAKYVHNNSENSEIDWDEIEDKDKKKKKVSRVKQRFNEELSKQITKQHLEELEAFEEIKEWFEKIKEATRG
ncbi:ATP-binding protein [Arcobacter defluvii]|uniref:ATP-binding protein (AAA domain) n=1 Tax=Arcobacter defluvii TaxID=873191 RepID=A0AAE7E7J6_9BACT|nr:ATP-binding protein [Arcobacter defluvii]QKF77438.1 ATP-binding protein (AAA domain) [Arcobacter defluvii]RXI32103.1 OLD family endonuclease [Arcobacter defluvii]